MLSGMLPPAIFELSTVEEGMPLSPLIDAPFLTFPKSLLVTSVGLPDVDELFFSLSLTLSFTLEAILNQVFFVAKRCCGVLQNKE